MNIKIFADGAKLEDFIELNKSNIVQGFTTNPTLMKEAGITNYLDFARIVTALIKDKPISLEVFSDNFDEMIKQGLLLSELGDNVYVKIPITNTLGESTKDVIYTLSRGYDVKVNITAIMTTDQINNVISYLNPDISSYISVFAGRIANTGIDPVPIMQRALQILTMNNQNCELIWASPRELLNIFQADQIGCHIITITNTILSNMYLIGKDLDEYSLETVKMFYNDAKSAGYVI